MKLTNALNALILAGAISVPAAFAQTSGASPQTAQDPTTQSSSPAGQERRTGGTSDQTVNRDAQTEGHVAGAAGEASRMGKSDQQFLTKAAQGGMMEIQLAQMAQEKASSEEVKEYARKLEEDHKKASEKLKEVAEERGVSLPQDLGPHAKQVQKLSKLSGEQFDRAYIQAQVKHHRKDISMHEKQANRGMDSSVKEYAENTVPVLQEHLRMAQELQSQVGTRARTPDRMSDRDRDDATMPDASRPGMDDPTRPGVNDPSRRGPIGPETSRPSTTNPDPTTRTDPSRNP